MLTIMSTKKAVLSRIGQMPETASFADIHEEIERMEILQACAEGMEDYKQGRYKSHNEVKELIKTWTTSR